MIRRVKRQRESERGRKKKCQISRKDRERESERERLRYRRRRNMLLHLLGNRDKKRKGRERKFENKNECSQIELKQLSRRVMIMKSNKKVPVSVNEIT